VAACGRAAGRLRTQRGCANARAAIACWGGCRAGGAGRLRIRRGGGPCLRCGTSAGRRRGGGGGARRAE
jgi:hypothetical protein